MNSKKYLFICGCPRSGTTALWTTLVSNKKIVLGVERYGSYFSHNKTLHQDLFSFERFFDLQPGDTFYSNLNEFSNYYEDAKVNYPDAIWVGDKIPRLYENFDNLIRDTPSAIFIMPLRNIEEVAMSYKIRQLNNEGDTWPADFGVKKAIDDWNLSLDVVNARRNNKNYILLDYDDLFYSDSDIFNKLLGFLDVPIDEKFVGTVTWMRKHAIELRKNRVDILSDQEKMEIESLANMALFNDLCHLSRSRF